MQKTFTLILSLLAINLVQAQPIFNTMKVMAEGDVISFKQNADETVEPGSAGANQVWDFSNVSFPGASSSTTLLDPATTGYASSFPTANRAEGESGTYNYYNMTSTSESVVGIYQNNTAIPFSDPLTEIQMPFAYNTTQSDTYAYSYTYLGILFSNTGTISTTFDGYGTLKTVNGTYNNVGRFKSTMTTTSVTDYSSFGLDKITTETSSVTYSYTLPGYSTSLFAIVDATVEDNTIRTVYLYDPSFLTGTQSAKLQDLKISVGPNPATETVSINFKDTPADTYEVSLMNEQGMVVSTENINTNGGDIHVTNISSLNTGIYFLKVSSQKGVYTEKIVKK